MFLNFILHFILLFFKFILELIEVQKLHLTNKNASIWDYITESHFFLKKLQIYHSLKHKKLILFLNIANFFYRRYDTVKLVVRLTTGINTTIP